MATGAIDTGTEQLLCEVRDRVALITLNRPESRNALGDIITPALRRQIRERGDDPDVGALLITGAGTAFCAGGDVKGMGNNRPTVELSHDQKVARLKERQRHRIAAETAFVSTGYARVGLSGDYGIAWLLTRLVGTAKARELLFTAERVDSATCERLGIVNRVVPDESFRDDAFAFAKSLAEGPAVALRQMKDNLDDALTEPFLTALDGEAERLVKTAQTADHKEAVRAFIEKRKPNFQGR